MNAPQPPAVVTIGPSRAGERAHRPVGQLARAVEIAVVGVQRAAAALLGRRRDAVAGRRERAAGRVRGAREHQVPDAAEEQRGGLAALGPDHAAHAQAGRRGHARRRLAGRAQRPRRREAVQAEQLAHAQHPARRGACATACRPPAAARAAWDRAPGPTASRACSSSAPYFTPAGHTGSQARQPRQNENSSRTSSSTSVPASSARMRLMRPRGEDASLRVSW